MPGLIVFTRYPQPGLAKTRLIPALGPERASSLHRHMAEHLLQEIRCLAEGSSFDLENVDPKRSSLPDLNLQDWNLQDLEICFTGGTVAQMQHWLGGDLRYEPQGEGDLGERLGTALRRQFQRGCEGVVVVGTDCPQLSKEILGRSFRALHTADLVIGPAWDGGYYLLGLRQFYPALFQGIAWSTDRVLAQTLTIAAALGLTIAMLESLPDIDRPEDLQHLPPGFLDALDPKT